MPLIEPHDRPGLHARVWSGIRRLGIRPLDLLIVALATAALIVLSISVYAGPSSAMLSVSVDGSEWIYPLSNDRVIEVPGLLGMTRIVIQNGAAHIEDSPCENKTCVASPPISRTGEWAACLPNAVFIVIQGAENDELDASVR